MAINFKKVKMYYQEQTEKAVANGFTNYFFVGELDRATASWLEDKLIRKLDFQIGPLDILYTDGKSNFRLYDGAYTKDFSLQKKDAFKLKTFQKVLVN